jgi:hypothetical protein
LKKKDQYGISPFALTVIGATPVEALSVTPTKAGKIITIN